MIVIIVPVHNRWELTRKFLQSLQQQTFQEYKIVIVNDCSNDETSKALKNDFPFVDEIKTSKEEWWTGSINAGCEHAINTYKDMEFIIIANNDLVVAEKTVETLYKYAKGNQDTIIGSITREYDNNDALYDGACQIDWLPFKCHQLQVNDNGLMFNNVDVLNGRFTIIPRQVFEKVNFNADKFPHYLGDLDFFLRAKNAGYRLALCCDAICFDTGGVSGFHALKKDHGITRFIRTQFSIASHENFIIFLRFLMQNAPSAKLKFYNITRRFRIFLVRLILAVAYSIFYPFIYMLFIFRKHKQPSSRN
ncbi:MAG: glycosyltransferase family 2 protein [Gammaproteobacteria bacterium]|nr:glycosyltransferase family 2 protein [Gammaproteobacteria bacterium]